MITVKFFAKNDSNIEPKLLAALNLFSDTLMEIGEFVTLNGKLYYIITKEWYIDTNLVEVHYTVDLMDIEDE